MASFDKDLLRNNEFVIYLSTRFLMTFALQMQNLILGWYLYKLTEDPLILGLIGLFEALPAILSALFAGHFVDNHDKRKVLLITFSIFLLCSLSFLFLSTDFVHSQLPTNTIIIGIYSILVILGFARAFAAPASFSILLYIFKKNQVSKASPMSSAAWQFGAILGPAIGGFVFDAFNQTIAFGWVAVFNVLAIISCAKLSPKPVILAQNTNQESMWKRIGDGLTYVFKNKVILSAISLDLFAVLFGGAIALLPMFADQVLHVGSSELGWLRAAPSAGSALILLVLSVKPPETKTGSKLLFAVAGFGLCMIFFALSKNYFLSLFILFASGAFDAVSVVIRGTILQIMTPDHMRGRVSAVNQIFIGSSNEIGAFESGAAAKLMGLIPSVLFGGTMTLLVVLTTYFKAPSLRNLELKYIKNEDITDNN